MPKITPPLSDTRIRNAKPKDKTYTITDGAGMYIEIAPTGSKIWRMSFKQANGKTNRLTFGPYPTVTIVEARAKRAEVSIFIKLATCFHPKRATRLHFKRAGLFH